MPFPPPGISAHRVLPSIRRGLLFRTRLLREKPEPRNFPDGHSSGYYPGLTSVILWGTGVTLYHRWHGRWGTFFSFKRFDRGLVLVLTRWLTRRAKGELIFCIPSGPCIIGGWLVRALPHGPAACAPGEFQGRVQEVSSAAIDHAGCWCNLTHHQHFNGKRSLLAAKPKTFKVETHYHHVTWSHGESERCSSKFFLNNIVGNFVQDTYITITSRDMTWRDGSLPLNLGSLDGLKPDFR
jgi:hypothetical protein